MSESLRFQNSMSYLESRNLLPSIIGNTDKSVPQIILWVGKGYIFHFARYYKNQSQIDFPIQKHFK